MKKLKFEAIDFWLWVLFLIFSAGFSPFALAQEGPIPQYAFIQGNILYKENKYPQAIEKYESIITQGIESGNLYYNLGNCYFKEGELGKALLNYERARRFIPADSDLKSNYDYARALLNLGPANVSGNWFFRQIDRLFSDIGLDFSALLCSLLYTAIFLLLIFSLFFSAIKRFFKPAIAALAVLFILSAIGLARKISYFEKGAIILRDTEVKFEPLAVATTYFKLGAGEWAGVIEKSGAWYKLRRNDGKSGWVEQSAIGIISE